MIRYDTLFLYVLFSEGFLGVAGCLDGLRGRDWEENLVVRMVDLHSRMWIRCLGSDV